MRVDALLPYWRTQIIKKLDTIIANYSTNGHEKMRKKRNEDWLFGFECLHFATMN